MGNSASSSDSSSELDLRYKSNLVNNNYGSMYIPNRLTSINTIATNTTAISSSSSSSKYHSNLCLNQNVKKSKINKILKFISTAQNNSLKVEKRNENKVKNRRSKNFITKSLIFFRTPSQKAKSPINSLKYSTPLDFNNIGSKSMSMYVEHDDLSSKFKTQLSLKSDKLSYQLNSSTDSEKNDSGIISDYRTIKNSMSTFSISDKKEKFNQIGSLSIKNSNNNSSNSNRRLSINSTIEISKDNQFKNGTNIRRTTTFHTTIKQDSSKPCNTTNGKKKPISLNIPHQIQSSTPLLTSKSNENSKSKKIVVQASTSELLRCLTCYLIKKYPYLIKEDIEPLTSSNRLKADSREIINWFRSADRALLLQGWQEIAFMNPVNVVFVYLLIRDSLQQPKTVFELQCHVMSCLYLAFSYMGNEISYPLKPFIVEDEREIFWQRIVSLTNLLSSSMLRINQDARFFTELFYELKSYTNQNQYEQTIQKSITINSFKTYDKNDKNLLTNTSRISTKPLVYSKSSKKMLNSPINFRNTHRESCLYPINDAPLYKPLAYCI